MRATALVGVASVTGGLLPLRTTSLSRPLDVLAPSGASEKNAVVGSQRSPAPCEKLQQLPLLSSRSWSRRLDEAGLGRHCLAVLVGKLCLGAEQTDLVASGCRTSAGWRRRRAEHADEHLVFSASGWWR